MNIFEFHTYAEEGDYTVQLYYLDGKFVLFKHGIGLPSTHTEFATRKEAMRESNSTIAALLELAFDEAKGVTE